MGEALARSEHNDASAQSLRQEGVADRPSSLEGQDEEDSGVQCVRSGELGDQGQNDGGSGSGSGQVESRVVSIICFVKTRIADVNQAATATRI